MSLKLYTSHELSQDECSYRIILLALPTPNIDENIVHHNLSNLIGYRMTQVNVYHTIIKEKLGTKSLNNMFSLFGESTTDFDTKEDKITRIITFLQTPNHPQPIEAIELVISKMLGSDVNSELQALKQSSVGTVSLCKKRLISVLSMESRGEEESSFNFSLNSTAESVKEESSLPSSLPPSHFFLKDRSRITGSRKRRRPGELNPTFHNISDYLAGLDNIKESKINEDLKLLKLNSAGTLKTKRRRIKSFFKVNGSDGKQDKQQLDLIQHRLDIIENSSVSLSNKL